MTETDKSKNIHLILPQNERQTQKIHEAQIKEESSLGGSLAFNPQVFVNLSSQTQMDLNFTNSISLSNASNIQGSQRNPYTLYQSSIQAQKLQISNITSNKQQSRAQSNTLRDPSSSNSNIIHEKNISLSNIINVENFFETLNYQTKKQFFLSIPEHILSKNLSEVKTKHRNPYKILIQNKVINPALQSVITNKCNVGYYFFPRLLLTCLYHKNSKQIRTGDILHEILIEFGKLLNKPVKFEKKIESLKDYFYFDQTNLSPLKNFIIFKFCVFFYFRQVSTKQLREIFIQIFDSNDLYQEFKELIEQNEETQLKQTLDQFQGNQKEQQKIESFHIALKDYTFEELKQIPFFGQFFYLQNEEIFFYICEAEQQRKFSQSQFLHLLVKCQGISLAHLKMSQGFLTKFSNQYTNIKFLNLWDCGIRCLSECSLQKLTSLERLHLQGNHLNVNDVKYLMKYVWPNLFKLGLGFSDGSVAWDLLADGIKIPFPKVYDLYFQVTPNIKSETIQRYNKMRTIGISAHFSYSQQLLKSLDNISIHNDAIDLTLSISQTYERRILKRLNTDNKQSDQKSNKFTKLINSFSIETLLSLQQKQLKSDQFCQITHNQQLQISTSEYNNNLISSFDNINDFKHQQNVNYQSNLSYQKEPQILQNLNFVQNQSSEQQNIIQSLQYESHQKIKHTNNQETQKSILEQESIKMDLNQKLQLVITIVKAIFSLQTFNQTNKVGQIFRQLQHLLLPTLKSIPIGDGSEKEKILIKILMFLMWKPITTNKFSDESKWKFQKIIQKLLKQKDQKKLFDVADNYRGNFELDDRLSKEQNRTLFELTINFLVKKMTIKQLRQTFERISFKVDNQFAYDFFSQIENDDNITEEFQKPIDFGENIDEINHRIRQQGLNDIKKSFYANYFVFMTKRLFFASHGDGAPSQKININQIVQIPSKYIYGAQLTGIMLDSEKILLLANKWNNLKVIYIWDCKITNLEGSGLETMPELHTLSLSNNPLDIRSAKYLISHQWPKIRQLRITFRDQNIGWDYFMSNVTKSFMNIKYLYLRQTHHISAETFEKIFAFSLEGIQVFLRASKISLNEIHKVIHKFIPNS